MQLRYVFTELAQGLRRNLSMHIAVVLTLFVSLTLVGLGGLLNKQADRTEEFFGDALQITVHLCRASDSNPACVNEVSQAQKDAILQVIKDSPDVESVEYESKAVAYERAKELGLLGPDDVQGAQPLVLEEDMPEAYRITLKDPHQIPVVKEQLEGLDGVSNIQDLSDFTGPVLSSVDEMKWGSFVVAFALVVAALLLVANTIRLAAFARRKEIGIMRLVGASTLYIALPFLLEALVTAVVGVVLALGALGAVIQLWIVGRLSDRVDIVPWIGWGDVGLTLAAVAVLGPLLTLVPTLLLTGKYLKV